MATDIVKVLLVEDDEDDYLITRNLLRAVETPRFVLDWVQTYEAGFDALVRNLHDVCLLDYGLGTGTGLELLREVIASGCRVPVILLTGQEDHTVDVEATQTGATDYLVKGQVNTTLLERALRYALERKRSELAMARQRAQFLAMLTHDIKNPLSVILGYTDLLIDNMNDGDPKTHSDILGRLKSNALTVHSLVTNYLDLSMIEAGHITLSKRVIDLNALLRKIGQQYETEAHLRHTHFDFALRPGLPLIEGDAIALERVFANLVYNALKFTPASGHITLRSEIRNGMVVAVVSDNGLGIAQTEIPRLFEHHKNMKSETQREGTGLGLCIVKSLVEAHGGHVEVESTLGEGSCFFVFLPTAKIAHPVSVTSAEARIFS
jgi:two-component system sensor histidine kinase/response regulator